MFRVRASVFLLLFSMSGIEILAANVDIVITNATVYDGTGHPPIQGYVVIKGAKIVSVGSGDPPAAIRSIDASGMVVSPGFIDLHTHSDRGVITPLGRSCVNHLMQGCTTVVTGNCGSGPINVKGYYNGIDGAGAGANVAHLLPQGALRSQVIGRENRKATEEELEKMRKLTRQAMQDGAWGMSTGLIYVPGTYSETAELVEIAREVAANRGIYVSHIRGEGDTLLNSVKEAIQIGRDAGLPTHISHLKITGKSNWGSIRLAAELIEQARADGAVVTADQYPYIASSTSLEATLFPAWARSGGAAALIKRLDDPQSGQRIRDDVSNGLDRRDDGAQIFIASNGKYPNWVGKSLKEIATTEGKSSLDIAEILIRNGGASVINFGMSEEDVRHAMTYPWVATASDGSSRIPSSERPHPRSYGTFPRKIGYYSIREEVIPLQQAIRSATGLPADILGLTDRGYLKAGQAADVVVFDPKTFIDRATFESPNQYAVGMQYVFVNGVPAVHDGIPTGALAGRALRKPETKEAKN